MYYFDGLVQNCGNSIGNALESPVIDYLWILYRTYRPNYGSAAIFVFTSSSNRQQR